ncbi:MAG TPA: hypothetical protein VLX56_00250 [Nitrososphaerales archaeon]|nr:hypothetical protein [Nitrososphaerales archaeon]
MVTRARPGVGRLAITLIVALIVIIGGVATYAYLATETASNSTTTTTSTSTTNPQVETPTPTFQNGSCGTGPAYADSWLLFKHDSERTGFSSYNFSTSSAGRFLGQLAWRNSSGFSEMAGVAERALRG